MEASSTLVSSATLQEQIYRTNQLVPRSKLSALQALDLGLATGGNLI